MKSTVEGKLDSVPKVAAFAGNIGRGMLVDGAAEQATFSRPYGIAVDSKGNIFVSDTQGDSILKNDTIRKITPEGVVSTFAGTAGFIGSIDGVGAAATFAGLKGMAIDSADNLYVVSGKSIR